MDIETSTNKGHTVKKANMPDVTSEGKARVQGALDRVGMSRVEIPLSVCDDNGKTFSIPAKADFFVSLDKENAKGIHMSRLYLMAQDILVDRELNYERIDELLKAFVSSHEGLSKSSYVRLDFEYMLRRPALLSNNEGWRFYPITLEGFYDGKTLRVDTKVRITYSSTCPCSAALARQLIQERFGDRFENKEQVGLEEVYQWLGSEDGLAATPHGQRSHADVTVRYGSLEQTLSFPELIYLIENTLATPVQTAVKREDEQEFARLNGDNLMFCEDAARIIRNTLESQERVVDYRIRIDHLESLHAHDAVAIVTKGVPGGLTP